MQRQISVVSLLEIAESELRTEIHVISWFFFRTMSSSLVAYVHVYIHISMYINLGVKTKTKRRISFEHDIK